MIELAANAKKKHSNKEYIQFFFIEISHNQSYEQYLHVPK